MPKVSWMTLTTGARQLVVQEALEMMLCFAASYLSVVDAEDDGDVLVAGGGGDDDLLDGAAEVGLGLFGVGEEAGGLDDDLGAYGGPVELGGVALGEDLDLLAVDGDEVGSVGDLVLEVAEDGVVLEQVGEGRRGGEVVYGYEFDIGVAEGGAEDVASDAAEAVDAYLYCHKSDCSLSCFCGSLATIAIKCEKRAATNGCYTETEVRSGVSGGGAGICEGFGAVLQASYARIARMDARQNETTP